MKKALFLCIITIHSAFAQPGHETTPASILPERAWWNLLHYTINIRPDLTGKYLSGTNYIEFRAMRPGKILQLDLMRPMSIRSMAWNGRSLSFERKDDAFLVSFPREIKKNEVVTIVVVFEGKPKEAVKPPWDGGWIWSKDKLGRPWVSLACESPGAMIWMPCKNV